MPSRFLPPPGAPKGVSFSLVSLPRVSALTEFGETPILSSSVCIIPWAAQYSRGPFSPGGSAHGAAPKLRFEAHPLAPFLLAPKGPINPEGNRDSTPCPKVPTRVPPAGADEFGVRGPPGPGPQSAEGPANFACLRLGGSSSLQPREGSSPAVHAGRRSNRSPGRGQRNRSSAGMRRPYQPAPCGTIHVLRAVESDLAQIIPPKALRHRPRREGRGRTVHCATESS